MDHPEVHILALSGQLDSRSAPELERELLSSLAKKRHSILLDFSQLEFISSAGLRVLVMTGKRLAAQGGALALCTLPPAVLEVFEVAGMTPLFPIHPSRAEAVRWLSRSTKLSRVSSLADSLLRKQDSERLPPRLPSAAGGGERSSLAAELLKDDDPKPGKAQPSGEPEQGGKG